MKVANSFNDGMNLDISDFLLKKSMLRFGMNVRLINLDGSAYLISNLPGTETIFQLTTHANGTPFRPVASKEFGDVLYIISWNELSGDLEVGSYPSPDPSSGEDIWKYRPFNNLTSTPSLTVGDVIKPFQTSAFDLASIPIIQELNIQPDYDRSVNLAFTIKGQSPRIINSKFVAITDNAGNLLLSPTADRAGVSNSNTYTSESVEKETRLIIYSDKLLGVTFGGMFPGGRLKPGNYTYVMYYMTEDFNRTNIVAQSSICQVAFGNDTNSIRGGDETEQTNIRTVLNLTNVDTDFKYIKIYFLYSAGQEGVFQQYLEINIPVPITGATMQFVHTGYEELTEVEPSSINLDYQTIDSANASTQVSGYLFLGGIRTVNYDYSLFTSASATAVIPYFKRINLPSSAKPGYADPANVYNYMGHFGKESYPYAIVYIMPKGELSPAFPIKGVKMTGTSGNPTYSDQANGIVTFPESNWYLPFEDSSIKVMGLEIDVAAIPDAIKNNSLGFFIARGERRTSLITQGLIIPTVKMPTLASYYEEDLGGTYFTKYKANEDDTSYFKHVPNLDSLIEAFVFLEKTNDGDIDDSVPVLDANNKVLNGYMPLSLNDFKAYDAVNYPEIFYSKSSETWLRHWALISGEALLDESNYVSSLNRDNCGILQLAKVNFEPSSQIEPSYLGYNLTGLNYNFKSFTKYTSQVIKKAKKISYVPGELFSAGSDFMSAIRTSFLHSQDSGSPNHRFFYRVDQRFNSYFGLEMATGSEGNLANSAKSTHITTDNNPIGANIRHSAINSRMVTHPIYDNVGTLVPGGFLVNVYDTTTPSSAADLYPSLGAISYRQVTARYTWAEAAALTNKIPVYGGDCYVGKIYRKLNQSGQRLSTLLEDTSEERSNIDSGQLVSWYQESKHNLALRQPKQFDVTEQEKRSFFPFQSSGDFYRYRTYRLPETVTYSKGYSELLRPKGIYAISGLSVYTETEFFSRISFSEKHIPNAFKNGFRSFIETNFRDYDSSMGRITGMFNHRGTLLVIFEHGMGVTTVEQRIQTSSDEGGPIFVKPDGVLPSTLSYISREIGCQDPLSMIQTPSGVYAVDKSKDKIWQYRDGLKVISDGVMGSFLVSNQLVNPRSGYDFENNEVIFTTDNWTICFREGLEKFTSFYSFRPTMYARRKKELYSFVNAQAHKHNAPVYTIYGEGKNVIVEFVVNEGLQQAKVADYLNIISNEVAPIKVEVYSYNQEVEVAETINVPGLSQYSIVNNGFDPITESETIAYRDKKFVVQIPNRSEYNVGSVKDEWAVEGRVRDKYFIIRLTYNTSSPLELATVISSFRYSPS